MPRSVNGYQPAGYYFGLKKFFRLFSHCGKDRFFVCLCFFNSLAGDVKILPFPFNAYKMPVVAHTGDTGRSATHKWVKHHVAYVCVGTHQPLHECHRLLRRVLVESLLVIPPVVTERQNRSRVRCAVRNSNRRGVGTFVSHLDN